MDVEMTWQRQADAVLLRLRRLEGDVSALNQGLLALSTAISLLNERLSPKSKRGRRLIHEVSENST